MHFSEDHDYILVFARDAEAWTPMGLEPTEEMNCSRKNPDNDPVVFGFSVILAARNFYANGRYPITHQTGELFWAAAAIIGGLAKTS